jgi:hypothetical protein
VCRWMTGWGSVDFTGWASYPRNASSFPRSDLVIPAEAGIQGVRLWVPAFAGTTIDLVIPAQ